jgi:hypothetical protein
MLKRLKMTLKELQDPENQKKFIDKVISLSNTKEDDYIFMSPKEIIHILECEKEILYDWGWQERALGIARAIYLIKEYFESKEINLPKILKEDSEMNLSDHKPETIYYLKYTKTFKISEPNTVTLHYKFSKHRDRLFTFMQAIAKKHGATLKKSEDPNHEFLFLDGDFIYYATSEHVDITFECYQDELI